jgi:hypothetical protein
LRVVVRADGPWRIKRKQGSRQCLPLPISAVQKKAPELRGLAFD